MCCSEGCWAPKSCWILRSLLCISVQRRENVKTMKMKQKLGKQRVCFQVDRIKYLREYDPERRVRTWTMARRCWRRCSMSASSSTSSPSKSSNLQIQNEKFRNMEHSLIQKSYLGNTCLSRRVTLSFLTRWVRQ